MKILIIGNGGREHAIAWKLAQSPQKPELFCAPGNAGIASIAQCHSDVAADDIAGQTRLATDLGVDLVVVGPEVPLALGVTDALVSAGIKVFGPDKNCSQLEASKSFTKSFLARHDIPTAGYKEYTDIAEIKKDVGIFGYPMVLKADGLAAGKGVVLAQNEAEALDAIDEMMGAKVFGSAGDLVVVEEYLTGVEASILCFVDGSAIIPMETAQDYKRIGDGDSGPNTGGMGTYSPSLVIDEALNERIDQEILQPTFAGFKKDGLDFHGVLFIGIMLTKDGPKVIEFNNRFGDPETQSVLPRMKADLLDVFLAVTEDKLSVTPIEWSNQCAVSVVLAAGGYPGDYHKGDKITGLDDAVADGETIVFHAGTKFDTDGDVVTAGGRVLCVTCLAASHEEAKEKAYNGVAKIHFDGAQFRTDIGTIRSTAK
ncbi:MAG: phosphoribosylamine--glycine ligase [Clostridiales Family XIII bacterium]|nr:phosphoribosylamine--glycine ligase [Clostridiales Family XIII bacterium]